eukprot:764844-Hanusia_phi.AAC.2
MGDGVALSEPLLHMLHAAVKSCGEGGGGRREKGKMMKAKREIPVPLAGQDPYKLGGPWQAGGT